MSSENLLTPKIFISYSWSSQAHQEMVVDLAIRLRTDGVDVLLDQWDFKEGQDKYSFMEKMVLDPSISRVLVLVDKIYAEKANSKAGGVGTESQIISSELYEKVDQTKFIPIVLEHDEDGPILPIFLKSRKYIDFSPYSKIDHYQHLIRILFNKPLNEKPPLGKPPQYLEASLVPKTTFLSQTFALAKVISSNSPTNIESAAKNIYRELVQEIKKQEIAAFTKEHHDEEILNSIYSLKVVQDSFLETSSKLVDFDPSSTLITVREYFEPILKSYHPKGSRYQTYQNDNIRFIAQESLLLLTSLLLKSESFGVFSNLTRTYLLGSKHDQVKNVHITELYSQLPSLEHVRNERLRLNRISVTADILKERSDREILTFEDIISADLVLFLRAIFKGNHWVPRTVVYKRDFEAAEIFIRAESAEYFKSLISSFNMYSPEEFKEKFEKAREDYRLNDYRISSNSWPIHFQNLINFQKLGTLT